ncbi:MAG: PqiC family protein [Rhodospirillaceae bacterium]
MNRSSAVALLSLLFALLGGGGCTPPPPPTLYVLQAPEAVAPAARPNPDRGGHRLAVALGPVTVPDYLDRTDIVRRAGDNRLDLGADERWAEPLRSGLQRLLIALLADRLGPGYWVTGGAGRAGQLEIEVPVDIEAFEEDAGGQAVLAATWEVRAGGRVARERTGYRRAVGSGRVEDRVRALSADVADLAADLAAAIRAQGRDR